MKVLILALDALEIELVDKFDCRWIQQAEYGKVDLSPVSRYTSINTQEVFACFLTGREFAQIGGRRFMEKGILPPEIPTIFEMDVCCLEIEVPTFRKSLGNRHKLLRSWIEKVLKGSLEHEVYDELVWRYTQAIERELFDLIDLHKGLWDWNLIMAYFPTLDLIGHVFHDDITTQAEYYLRMDAMVEKIKRILDEELHGKHVMLIMSDHGMKKGLHTSYGFYSLNLPLGLKNPKITDFYELIGSWLKRW